ERLVEPHTPGLDGAGFGSLTDSSQAVPAGFPRGAGVGSLTDSGQIVPAGYYREELPRQKLICKPGSLCVGQVVQALAEALLQVGGEVDKVQTRTLLLATQLI